MSGTGGGLPAPVIPAIGAVPGQSYRLSPRAVRDRMRERLLGDAQRSLRAALSAELAKPPRITQVDAVLFTGGVLNLCLTEVVFLLWPAKLGLWFTGWTLPLMAWRYHSYKKQKWHYFLIDMCYLVNWLCLLHLWVFPDSPLLFEVSFSLASGPVAWAILAWRNALVFHSVDKITSLFIHAMPPLVMYTQRWHYSPGPIGSPAEKLPAYLRCVPHASTADACSRTYWEALVLPVGCYVAWQVAYYLRTEVVGAHELRADPEVQTSLRWLARAQKGALHDLTKATMVRLGLMTAEEPFDSETAKTKFAFMGVQLVYTLLTLLPTRLMQNSHTVHAGFLLLWGVAAVWHGGEFYIEVFSRKYIRDLEASLLGGAAAPAGAGAGAGGDGSGGGARNGTGGAWTDAPGGRQQRQGSAPSSASAGTGSATGSSLAGSPLAEEPAALISPASLSSAAPVSAGQLFTLGSLVDGGLPLTPSSALLSERRLKGDKDA